MTTHNIEHWQHSHRFPTLTTSHLKQRLTFLPQCLLWDKKILETAVIWIPYMCGYVLNVQFAEQCQQFLQLLIQSSVVSSDPLVLLQQPLHRHNMCNQHNSQQKTLYIKPHSAIHCVVYCYLCNLPAVQQLYNMLNMHSYVCTHT